MRFTFTRHWPSLTSWVWIALVFTVTLHSDFQQLRWVERLSLEGNPPPEEDASSVTGYAFGQRHFLGYRNRGETYRWIAYAQDILAYGILDSERDPNDSAPAGREQLLPKLYAAWLALIAGAHSVATGSPLALSAEASALWEPLIAHSLVLIGLAIFFQRRFGPVAASAAVTFFALFPLFSAQFIPGTLTPETWALFLGSYALAACVFPISGERTFRLHWPTAIAASAALWLDPYIGFSVVLICSLVALASILLGNRDSRFLAWSITGALATTLAWAIDQNPLAIHPSELRYVHPLYGLAWLGLGVGLQACQAHVAKTGRRRLRFAQFAAATLLVAPLIYAQAANGYAGWLFSGASMLRLSALDETKAYGNLLAWIADSSLAESVLIALPALLAGFVLAIALGPRWRAGTPSGQSKRAALFAALFLCLAALAAFKVRWFVSLSLFALPVVWWHGARQKGELLRYLFPAFGIAYAFSLFAWGKMLPETLSKPEGLTEPDEKDLEALVHRHFSHWLATHNPESELAVLAPPEMSDSINFHGGSKTLMSTAWETYPGQVASSRILSAPEASEAEAVIESLQVSHVVLTSWDPVLPLLVQAPLDESKSTLYERLQEWVMPLYLRAMPYHLPPIPGYQTQKVAVFKVTPPQDEALALSRLAEYFVEMRRSEPAALAAESLTEAFPDDPNATVARAFVYADQKDYRKFNQQLAALLEDVRLGLAPRDWDRQALRAIILALGKQNAVAKSELQACLDSMSKESLSRLTPLHAYHLTRLVALYDLNFPNAETRKLAHLYSSEYH